MMDTFFDCLNVSRVVNKSNKSARDTYKSKDDKRFEVRITKNSQKDLTVEYLPPFRKVVNSNPE